MRTYQGHTGYVNSIFVKGNFLYSGSEDSTVRKWDITSGDVIKTYKHRMPQGELGETNAVFTVHVNGNNLFSGTFDGSIVQWNIENGEIIQVFSGHTDFITCLWVRSGFLYSSSYDGTIRKWDVSTGQIKHVFRGHSGPVTSFWITDLHLFSGGAGDASIRKWNIHNASAVDVKSTDSGVICMAMQGDKLYFGSRNGRVQQLDIVTNEIKFVHKVHTDPVTCITIRDDHLFTGSGDMNIIRWDLSLGQLGRVYKGHEDIITCLFIVGDKMFSGSDDGMIIQWDIARDGETELSRAPNVEVRAPGVYNPNVYVTDNLERAPGVYNLYGNPSIRAPEHEEDSDNSESTRSDSESLPISTSTADCSNDNIITLEPYTREEDPIKIYTLNSKTGKFSKSICITEDELESHLRAGLDTKYPDMLMTIYTTPPDRNASGHGGNATGKFVVKLPPFNMFFTLGSVARIIKSRTRTWYALPLYGGKRRRIGNLDESFASSSHHGQIPGFVIYKVFTREEIESNVDVKETADDYPTIFLYNNSKILYDIIGEEISVSFVNRTIGELLRK